MPIILFLHGALGSSSQFASLIDKFPESCECHALDFPLHGNNADDIEFTMEHFADHIISYVEKNKWKKVFVFGYSMGGYAALYAATKRPELFDRIATLATKFKWNPEIATKEKEMLDAEQIERKIPAFAEQLTQRHKHIDWKEMLQRTAGLLENLGVGNVLTPVRLEALPMEVMVGLGDKDSMVSMEETLNVYKQLKFGSLYILPDTKHPFEKVNENLLLCHLQNFFNC